MIQTVRRLSQYTQKKYKKYCKKKHIEYHSDDLFLWSIDQQNKELSNIIYNIGPEKKVEIVGYIQIGSDYYQIKEKLLQVYDAFNQMITPDLYDFDVYYNPESDKYYLNGYHDGNCVNTFEFYLI